MGNQVTSFLKRVNISKSFFKLVSITQYTLLLNYVLLCNSEEPYIKLPTYIHDRNCFSNV